MGEYKPSLSVCGNRSWGRIEENSNAVKSTKNDSF